MIIKLSKCKLVNYTFLKVALLVFAQMLSFSSLSAVGVIPACFSHPESYTANGDHELTNDENIAGKTLNYSGHIVASGAELEANCDCSQTALTKSSTVYETSFAGSPLLAGSEEGYGYLNDYMDIDVTAYTDAIDHQDGAGLPGMTINVYPTPVSARESKYNSVANSEQKASVCRDGTRPSGATDTKRRFKWNVMAFTLKVKKAIVGEVVIPPIVVVQNYSCLSFGSSSPCTRDMGEHVSDIYLSGTLSAPLSCTINAGSTIEVSLGVIAAKQFFGKGQKPSGYSPQKVDISYHCDNDPLRSSSDTVKMTLTADQGVASGSKGLIANMVDRSDIGVRMFYADDKDVTLDGSVDIPVVIDQDGNGHVAMTATPVSTTDQTPTAGKFEGYITVKMDLR